MKELSIEDKAKRYDNALERANKLKETCDSNAVIGWMEYIFPELKKSEDERIRKDIIVLIKDWWDRVNKDNISTKEQMLAWLEKQGEKKPAWSEEDRKIIIELIGIFESAVDGGHVTFPYRLLKDYIRVLNSCLSQNTWKPSDEQLEALDFAADCIVPAEFCFKRRVLKELLEQLKKLKA